MEGYIICNDTMDFQDNHNNCDYNDLVVKYKVMTSEHSIGTTTVNLEFLFLYRGSWYDHEFGLIIPIIEQSEGEQRCYTRKTTWTSDFGPTIDETLNIENNKLVVTNSTKSLLPPNPGLDNQFCNTWGNWNTPVSRVAPAKVEITLSLPTVLYKKVKTLILSSATFPFGTPYISVIPSQGKSFERNTELNLLCPPKLWDKGVRYLKAMYVVRPRGTLTFRPPKEKISIFDAYPDFLKFVTSSDKQEDDWTLKFQSDLICDSVE